MWWKRVGVRRRLTKVGEKKIEDGKARMFRVLGVDPASAGPTGYGIVESDGKTCRVLQYGALRVAAKRQKASRGAALQDVHKLLCDLLEEFAPQAMAVE